MLVACPAAVLAAPVLQACGPLGGGAADQPAPGGPKKVLTFSSYTFSGYEEAMRQMLRLFEQENPSVEVKAEFGGDDYWTKVQTQMASDTTPDTGIAEYNRTVSFAKLGGLLPLDDLIARDRYPMDQFLPAGVAQYRWRAGDFNSGGQGGKQYGLPSDAQGFIFAYNKSLFDRAGVAHPTDSWTWDDLLAAARRLTRPEEDKWGVAMPGLGTLNRGNFVYAAGGNPIAPDYKKSGLDTTETIAAYKWAWDLTFTHRVAPPPGTGGPAHPFASGRVAMYFDGVWYIADFLKIRTDFDWDLAMFPKHPTTGKRTTSLESDGWWIYRATKERDLAWRFLKFLAGESGQRKFSELEFIVPPSIPKIAREWYARKPPEHRSKALDNLTQDARPVSITYFEAGPIVSAYNRVLQRSFRDGEDIVATMKEAAQVMNQELTRAWQKFA
jgi:multiple sugar transport system substrate-binding protein